MTVFYSSIAGAVMFLSAVTFAAESPQEYPMRPDQIQRLLGADVPRVLCLDEDFTTGGQPNANAYAKAAAAGFKSILSLRMANEGVDIPRERAQVESKKMRYFNIPVNSSSPRPEQADEFLRIARDKANHPMLVNCASANRVGAFMMILRVVDQGWSEEKALVEATRIGLRGEELKKFAKDYIAARKPKHQS